MAHEVAHLVYGTRSEIADWGFECYNPKSPAERQANILAAKLLLPVCHVQAHVFTPVIDPAVVRKLAKAAVVSEQTVALRLAGLAGELGLGTAAVVAFGPAGVVWKRLSGIDLADNDLIRLYESACKASGRLHREQGRPGRLLVASALSNPSVPILLIQDLPVDQAVTVSAAEKLRAAGAALFIGDGKFRNSLEGKFGAFKPVVKGMSLEDALVAFVDRYRDKWESPAHTRKFISIACQRYIRLKLSQWVG